MYCHECANDFTAELDMGINGNHEIECPHCGHIHYRVVEDGEVTSERYRSSMQTTTNTTTYTNVSSSSQTSSSTWTATSWDNTTAGYWL